MSGQIDLTPMYAAHDAFRRDLDRLAAAVAAGKAGSPRVRAGWANFKYQLHLHHTVEDAVLWPRLRQKSRGKPRELSLLGQMEDEHSHIDPLLSAVDAALSVQSDAMVDRVADLRTALARHLDHEERSALPLIRSLFTQEDWAVFTGEIRRRQGMAVFVPWVVDGIMPTDRSRFLATLPAPVRGLNRLTWEPRYRKLRLWAA